MEVFGCVLRRQRVSEIRLKGVKSLKNIDRYSGEVTKIGGVTVEKAGGK